MELISQEEVLKIAQISNIMLSDQEIVQMQKELSQVLDYAIRVTQVQGDIDVKQIVQDNIVREDIPHASLGQALVACSTNHDHGYFVVPLILEQY
jgi:aspartyl/glutamyl-tRNA(Asn/Gln) amidotransferase C subunit